MIRIIHRCLTNSELTEKKWNNHIALFHLNEFKNAKEIYLNGKPLRWYHIFKNGDIIEVIDRPAISLAIAGTIGAAILSTVGISVAATTTAAIVTGIVASVVVSAALSFGLSMLGKTLAGRGSASGSTTQRKEYSSTTQPELRGASNDISNDIIPVVFGRTQQAPSYAQTPYRLVQDGSSNILSEIIKMLFILISSLVIHR